MADYIAVERSKYLCHFNKIHGEHGWFGRGDGDGDGIVDDHHNQKKSEYKNSNRYKTDSDAARSRLDDYYKNLGEDENYTTKSGPSGSRRSANPYVDKDGNLTEAGWRRYNAELRANDRKPKDKRAKSDEDLLDPKHWVEDDIKTLSNLAKTHKEISKDTKSLGNDFFKPKKKERLDLSSMSDNEIRAAINREVIEKQYNDLFNGPEENKAATIFNGAMKVNDFITDQAILGLTIAGLIVALAH